MSTSHRVMMLCSWRVKAVRLIPFVWINVLGGRCDAVNMCRTKLVNVFLCHRSG